MNLYLDTTVLVSCYVAEKQTTAVLSKLENTPSELIVSQLTEVEFYSALSIKQRGKEISSSQKKAVLELFQKHLETNQYTRAYLTEDTYQLAKKILLDNTIKLRTLDALHLSLANLLQAELFTADVELAKAAEKLKFSYQQVI